MITFLWLLFLAATLIVTVYSLLLIIFIFKLIQADLLEDSDLYLTLIGIGVSCIMWAIWYMYFLH